MKTLKIVTRTALISLLLMLASCSNDLSKTATGKTFVIRGKALSGAHPGTRKPVAGGYVGLVSPEPSKWMPLSFATQSGVPNKAVTNADGSFTFTVDLSIIVTEYPIFLAVSDSGQTYTMISEIPVNLAVEDAQLDLNINPTTTVAGQMICPGGVYPPKSNGYCYSDPNNASTTKDAMETSIDSLLAGADVAVETGAPPNWKTFITTLLSDAATFDDLKAILNKAGLTSTDLTASAIESSLISLPIVTEPVYGIDDNDPNPSTPSDSSGGGSCSGGWIGSEASCVPLGAGGSCVCSGSTSTCVSKSEFESVTGLTFPSACAPAGTTGCMNGEKGTLIKPCCSGLSCKLSSKCGGGSNVGGICG
ncbi:hypothetical protein WDW37_11750 [Bdellovibrionota bacterium FG-1]